MNCEHLSGTGTQYIENFQRKKPPTLAEELFKYKKIFSNNYLMAILFDFFIRGQVNGMAKNRKPPCSKEIGRGGLVFTLNDRNHLRRNELLRTKFYSCEVKRFGIFFTWTT